MTAGPAVAQRRGVFLDRDGVLNEVVWRDGVPSSPRSLDELVLCPGVTEAVQALRAAGHVVCLVTNQPDLARGRLAWPVHEALLTRIRSAIPVDAIYVCPHDDRDGCRCRKPQPGMLLQAATEWHLRLPDSYLIGDSWKDMEAGRQAGCRTILLDRPYNTSAQADVRTATLAAAVTAILRDDDREEGR